jgi:hypothetical protein
MEYCKNCHDSLEITRNNKRSDADIQTIATPSELDKLKVKEDQQYMINFNEGALRYYIAENQLNEAKEKELFKKFNTMLKQQKDVAKFIFLCNNCNTSYVIQPGTVLYNISFDNKSSTIEEDDADVKTSDPILPRTKDYVCPNGRCESHKDKINKEAVFYRVGHGYHLKYICCVCKTPWNV